MKNPLLILAVLFLTTNVGWAQNEDEEYQRKLEAWKRQKEAIERQNQEKLNSLGSQKAARAHFKNGGDYYRQGDYAAAVREFQEAVRKDPSYSKAYINLGLAYRRLGDFESALKNYDKAVEMSPGSAEIKLSATSYKANLYVDTKDYKKAIATMDLYLKDNPNDGDMLYLKGKVIKDGLGKLGESIQILQQAVQADPNLAKAYLELANAFNVNADQTNAVSSAQKGLSVSKDAETTAGLNFELADAYRKAGNVGEAVKYYNNSKTSRRYRESAEYWIKTLGAK